MSNDMADIKDINSKKPASVVPKQDAFNCGAAVNTETMENFLHSFQQSTKLWEKVVYPAMFAFVILSLYGFFMVYSLTSDMSKIAEAIGPDMSVNMQNISGDMQAMSHNINSMTAQINDMSGNLKTMTAQMNSLENLSPMLGELEEMQSSIGSMQRSVGDMGYSVGNLDRSVNSMNMSTYRMSRDMRKVSRPMKFMNNFMP